jgi:N-methylhydantoinase B
MRRFPPRGVQGGGSGALGRLHCVPSDGPEFTPPAYGIRMTGPCRLSMSSQGGGGWGDPLDRAPTRVLEDVRDGIVSRQAALAIYGLVLGNDGATIEHAATKQQRERLRCGRPIESS